MKLKKWSPAKEILFIYLAVNKIMYWINIFAGMEQINFASGGAVILNRFLNQDLMLILCILLLYYLDQHIKVKSQKYHVVVHHAILYSLGYLFIAGISFALNAYFRIIVEGDSWRVFVGDFVEFLPMATLGYVVIIAGLEIKLYFKELGKKTSEKPVLSVNDGDKLSMLKLLLDDGILSQEEFEAKKEMLQSASQA